MLEIRRADELGESARAGICAVFVDGFGEYLDYFAKDRARLVDAFAHMLVLDLFHVAVIDGQPAGIAACTDGQQLPLRHDRAVLRQQLGFVKGTIADFVFRREFQKPWATTTDGVASVEFVATAAQHRGRGVATALLNHLLALPQYHEYVLEDVADTNAPALAVYEKLGFREFRREKVRHTRRTGINYYVSLKLVQE
ncbi:GNAT family N-acetyltransferase [Saccharothrix algeriensis]|uniref:Ribosomal protein S18 acetylase RimI-like enzyme n=2 Tax=Saccharothrix algeriensis TaxID=173560 RepID=A0ABS2S1L1_9PSEU|nr:GNAT family N-acetyltransferase [Saccharothrix algeriensis]MBM7809755.1 ribosomal protein S18 acetylase RimI-like enzyme [Saccharothrix algeriensis]